MLEINCEVPKDTVRDFEKSFTRFHTVLGNGMGTAIRRGFSALCRSLIARTKVAPKLVPTTSVQRHDHNVLGGPSYITPKGHNQKPVPRWRITRREKSEDSWGYSKVAQSAAQARKKYGKISNAGRAAAALANQPGESDECGRHLNKALAGIELAAHVARWRQEGYPPPRRAD